MAGKQQAPTPQSVDKFADWLRGWITVIQDWQGSEMQETEPGDCADLAYEAQVYGFRFGVCELPAQHYINLPHEEAIAVLSRLLDACERKKIEALPSDAQLTVAQAAKRLNIAESTIYDLVENNEIPHKRYGTGRGTIRIRLCDLLEYSKTQVVPAKPGAVTLKQLLES